MREKYSSGWKKQAELAQPNTPDGSPSHLTLHSNIAACRKVMAQTAEIRCAMPMDHILKVERKGEINRDNKPTKADLL